MNLLAPAVSAALLDLLWQGALVGGALWLALAALRHRTATARYAVSCLALLLLAVLPVFTVATLWMVTAGSDTAGVTAAVAAGTSPAAARVVESPMPQTLLQIWMVPETPRAAWLDALEPWILPIWSIGVLLLSVRLAASCVHAHRTAARAGAADPSLQSMATSLARRIGVTRDVRIRTPAPTAGPGVVGWLRPVILMPPAAAMGLTPIQLEAVLAHELAHVKRHDYLVNMLQVIVETLFFYHPVVWWTSQRIRVERELCCDDVAVRACGNAVDFARGLATLARRQLTPALAQSVTGGPLAHRVRRLLGVAPREMAAADLAGVVVVAVAVAAIALHVDRLQAQEPRLSADQPRFEVASIKPNTLNDGIIIGRADATRFTARGYPLAELIRQAYDVQEFQIADGPDWMNSLRFDIVATFPANAMRGERGPAPADQDLMLRALLEERFKLSVHKETQQKPVFALVLAKPEGTLGAQLRRSTADCTQLRPVGECGGWVGPGYIRQRGKTMAQVATEFSKLTNTGSSLNRLVVDRTGLEGAFDLDLRFTPEVIPPLGGGRPEWLPGIDPNGASIFTAVQDQLGLKLDPQRGPVEVLVIDRVERPTED